MEETIDNRKGRILTDPQARRSVFIAAWLSHGNVRRAMREAGVGSPTTAYRWIAAYREKGAAALEIDVARPSRSVATEIAEQIVAMREQNPTWGKERIARRLAERYGTPVVSPTGVRSVLREVGLWSPPNVPLPKGTGSQSNIDPEEFAERAKLGIRQDLLSRPHEAVGVLEGRVWGPLLLRQEELPAVLNEPKAGSWILRSALQLAHALIETGRWGSALRYLRLVERWLDHSQRSPSREQQAYQDEGDRWITEGSSAWTTGSDPPEGTDRISLRHDDIWLETQQYLGVVLRDAVGEEALDALTEARHALRGRTPRQIHPDRVVHYRGVISHDIAALKLRRRYPARLVQPELDRADAWLHEAGIRGFIASINLARAGLLAAEIEQQSTLTGIDKLERSVWAAFETAATIGEAAIQVRVAIEGTELLLKHREPSEQDRDRLASAARTAIDRRYSVQARKLLEVPTLRQLVTDFEESLNDITG